MIVSIALIAVASVPAATNDLTSLLQKGLFEEEANRNLDAAISSYQSLAAQFDKDRQIAATAIFRLGECYRKLGRTNDAVAQYERIVREFSDQQSLATLSQQNLAGLGAGNSFRAATGAPPSSGAPLSSGARAESRRLLEEEIKLVEKKLADLQGLVVQKLATPSAVVPVQRELLGLKRQLVELSDSADDLLVTDEEQQEIRRIEVMIQSSPDLINAPGGPKGTPLFRAAGAGWQRVATYLLDHGANINLKNVGQTPLDNATQNGHKAMVELLLRRGADIKATSSDLSTPLHTAAERGFLAVAEVLLSNKSDPNAQNNGGETPLHRAATQDRPDMIKLLISRGADVNARNRFGMTPVQNAVRSKTLGSVEALLAAKADPDAPDDEGRTPLSWAAEVGSIDIARALLAARANPNAGKTQLPLTAVIESGNEFAKPPFIELLLQNGADPNLAASVRLRDPVPYRLSSSSTTSQIRANALQIAVLRRQAANAKLLLDHKADPNIVSHRGIPILCESIMDNTVQIVEAMLQQGADPNIRDSVGSTPLHYAVGYGQRTMAELLLNNKADANVRNDNAETPLDRVNQNISRSDSAGRKSWEELAAVLRQHGALDELPNYSVIRVTRPGFVQPSVIFARGTNDWNRFTLFEALTVAYLRLNNSAGGIPRMIPRGAMPGGIPAGMPLGVTVASEWAFPDLNRLIIHRPIRTTGGSQEIRINMLSVSNSIECARDVVLQFGDVIEIPFREHTLNEPNYGLLYGELDELADCLQRKVQLMVRGQTRQLTLRSDFDRGGLGRLYLSSALKTSEATSLLLSSSDLSKIKVTRKDPQTGKTTEIIANQAGTGGELLLRDGDVIDVPEK